MSTENLSSLFTLPSFVANNKSGMKFWMKHVFRAVFFLCVLLFLSYFPFLIGSNPRPAFAIISPPCLCQCVNAPSNTCNNNNGTYSCNPAGCSPNDGKACTANTCTSTTCISQSCFGPDTISGQVFIHTSQSTNGADEITVIATSTNGKVILLTVTGQSYTGNYTNVYEGGYVFTNVPPGTYTVSLVAAELPNPPYQISNPVTVTVTATTSPTANFTITANPPFPCVTYNNRISGNVFLDSDQNGLYTIPPDSKYTNTNSTVTISKQGGGLNRSVTVSDGFYTFGDLPPGTYTVTYSSLPAGYNLSTPSPAVIQVNGGVCGWACKIDCTVGQNTTNINFGIYLQSAPPPSLSPACSPPNCYSIAGNIYNDIDQNGVFGGSDTRYSGGTSTVTFTGPVNTFTTTGTGQYATGTNLPAGTYTVNYTSLPSGYQMTYPVNGPPPSFSVTVGPSCNTNGANDATCPTTPPVTNTVTLDNANSAQLTGGNTTTITWNHTIGSQSNRFLVVGIQQLFNRPFVSVTYHNINLTRLTTAAGTGPLYEDIWYLKDPGLSSLPGGTYPITATSSVSNNDWYTVGAATYYNIDQTTPFPPGSVVTNSGFSGISPISVTVPSNTTQLVIDVTSVALTSTTDSITPNSGQATIWNQNAIGPQVIGSSSKPGQSVNTTLGWSTTSPGAFWVDVGLPLNPSTSPGPPTGNITGLDFGITNNVPWFQAFCADIRQESNGGINDFIPASPSCGGTATTNMIMSNATCPNPANSGNGSNGNNNNIPGIAFTGDNSAYFGQGQASTNPFNCVVGGIQYSEVFTPVNSTVIRTSYDYMQTTARQSGLTPTNIAPYCTGGIGNCALSNTLPHGLYQATGALTLTGLGYTFGTNQDYVILVNGDLTIQEPIHVPAGSTVTFSVAGDIHVDKSVGEATLTSLTPDIEGLYSADKSFFIDSYGQPGSVCNANGTPIDKKLNIQGAVVVNAAELGGTFQNNRNLCNQNPSCPTFTVTSRPDMLLNAPQFIKHQQSLWQEVIP